MKIVDKGRYWQIGIELVSGCTPCSPGCDNCWSAAMTNRFGAAGMLNDKSGAFVGTILCHPERLKRFNARKPKVFAIWNDLFHEGVPESFQNEVYREMVINKQNTYLVLTKRPYKMAKFLSPETCFTRPLFDHIYHGLTVCNQKEADEKIPIFLQVPGKKFLSIEPMLSDIRMSKYLLNLVKENGTGRIIQKSQIDAVILGGETSHNARPLHPDWVRSVRDQCANFGVPFFFKGWGAWLPLPTFHYSPSLWSGNKEYCKALSKYQRAHSAKILIDDRAEGWEPFMIRNGMAIVTGESPMGRVGRKKAGRVLDGRMHDDLPWEKPLE